MRFHKVRECRRWRLARFLVDRMIVPDNVLSQAAIQAPAPGEVQASDIEVFLRRNMAAVSTEFTGSDASGTDSPNRYH